MTTLSALHDCPKCHGKIVGVAVDASGRTYCGYCGEAVDYAKYWDRKGRITPEGDAA